ncbi:MAG: hypothetical protein ABSH38_13975 [Verrucomicrobiota bacterium]|jgi:hypothetical protein
MKIPHFLCTLSVVSLTACSTTTSNEKQASSKTDPETVLVTYHVRSGKEAEFQELLSRAWEIYRKEHLVFAQPHVIVQDKESGDKPRFIEIFTWVSHSAPEHAPGSVKTIWDQMQSQCEARDGHGGLVGGEVDLLAPHAR